MPRRNIKNEPDQEFNKFRQEVARLLDAESFMPQQMHCAYTWRPPTDIYETDSSVIVKAEIAGLNKNDFNISYRDHVLTIQATRNDTEEKLNYHCMEIQYGFFQIRILVRGSYDEDNIKTNYKNGYIYIVLPKLNNVTDESIK